MSSTTRYTLTFEWAADDAQDEALLDMLNGFGDRIEAHLVAPDLVDIHSQQVLR